MKIHRHLASELVAAALILAGSAPPIQAQTIISNTVLHSFTATSGSFFTNSDGSFPNGVILSGNTLYGTAYFGGAAGSGTVFSVNTNGTDFTTLHGFTGGSDGANPFASLILAGNTLYGTAGGAGRISGYGAVFKVNTDGTGFTTLHSFASGSEGAYPDASLILSGDTLYGTTYAGGAPGQGTVFSVNTNGAGFTTLYSFAGDTDGANPAAGLILAGNALYGTAEAGGIAGNGTVFKVNTDGTGFITLHSFTAVSDGAFPEASLILSGDTLYGTTYYGGASGDGTVFALNTNGAGFTTLYSFTATSAASPNTNSDGANPVAGLSLSGNTLYGTAMNGGPSGDGTVFALNTNGAGFATLYSFTATSATSPNTNSDGSLPGAGLSISGNTLYGTAYYGGTSGDGTVFALNLPPAPGATPSITWTNPAAITFGTALGPAQLNASAGVPGTFAYDPPAGTVLNLGTNTLSVVFTPDDTVDYTSVTNTVSLVVLPLGPGQCLPPPLGLVAWWSGDGQASDLTTNHNDGTLQGDATYAPGNDGMAFSFSGSGYVEIGDQADLDMSNAFSFEGWIFPTGPGSSPTGYSILINKENQYEVARYSDGTIQWAFANSNPGWIFMDTGAVAPLNQWTHVAVVYSNGIVNTYLNGVLTNTYNGSGLIGSFTSPNDFRIGGRSAMNEFFEGLIDEVSVYSQPLSSNQVAAIYAAGAAGKCQELKFLAPPPTNAVSYVGVSNAPMSVVASGTGTLAYQWWRGTTLLAGQTNAALTLPNPQFSDAGNYTVVVADSTGASITNAAPVTLDVLLCDPPPSGLVAWWPGDGNFFDIAGTNNGTPTGGVSFAPGMVGQAFSFNGAGSVVDEGTNDAFDFNGGNGDLTIEAWINLATLPPTAEGFVSKDAGGPPYSGWAFYCYSDGRLAFGGAGVWELTTAPGVLSAGVWYHVAVVKSGNNYSLYCNGILAASTSHAGALETSPASLQLGTSLQWWMSGLLDEVGIYTNALSAAQIQAIYNAGSDGKCKELTILAPPANAVSYVGVSNAPFYVVASGTGTLTYQWWRGTTLLASQTNAALTLPNPQFADAGNYTVIVTDANGSITNLAPATLTVKPCEDTMEGGLVGWWPGDGQADDLTTNHNNGVLETGAGYATGMVGQAFSFNGAQGGVWIPASPSLDVGAGDAFTFVAWIFRTGQIPGRSDWWAPIFEYYSGVDFWQDSTPSGLYVNVFDTGGTSHTLYADGSLTPAAWNQVALTYSKTTGQVTIYANGAPAASAHVGAFTPRTSTALSLGSRAAGSFNDVAYAFNGLIDEPALYNRALSDAEIATLYAARQDGMCKALQILGLPQNPVAYVGVSNALSVTASGAGALTYQWWWNGAALAGQTNAVLSFANPQPANAGNYTVVVGDATGQFITNSVPVVLDVQPCAAVPGGLAGWWPGDGHFFDLASTNYGVGINGVSFGPGVAGPAFVLDGDRQFVRLGNPTNLQLQTFTLAAWVKRASASQVSRYTPQGPSGLVISYGQNGYGLGIANDGTLGLNQIGVSGVSPVEPYLKVNDTNWHHIVVTEDGSTVVFYMDGVAGAPLSYAPGFQFTTGLAIGARADTMGNSFWGGIDEAMIFNRALAPAEVTALFASGADGICKPAELLVAPLQNQTAYPGLACALNVAAYSSAGPLSYQWRMEGVNLDNATNATFVITNAQQINAGNYDVVVSDTVNVTTSSVAVVTLSLCGAMPPGLAGWWPGDGHAYDLTGNNNGSLQDGAAYAPGMVGQAFSFSGAAGNFVQVPSSASLNLPQFSIQLWAFLDPSVLASGNRNAALVTKGDGSSCAGGFYLGYQNYASSYTNSLTFQVMAGCGAYSGVWITNAVPAAGFYHIVAVFDGNLASLYLNGNLAATSTALVSGMAFNGYALRIGESYGASDAFPGLIDEVMLFNRPLNSDEIAALYDTGSAGACKALQILAQPQSLTTNVTQAVTFTVASSGTGVLGYQWWKDLTNAIDGATNNSLLFTNLQLSDAASYSVVVSDDFGSITSAPAALKLIAPPVITSFTPDAGMAGNVVMVAGANLAGVFQVLFGGANATFLVASDTNLWVYIPPGATNGAFSVTTLSGTVASPGDVTLNSTPACLAPPPNLLAWWAAEGSADDLVGTNHGNLQGGVSFGPGEAGQAFAFHGGSDSVVVPDCASLELTGQFTVEAWINPADYTSEAIVSKIGGPAGNYGYQFATGGGSLWASFNSPGQSWPEFSISSPALVTPGVWNHVAWTYDQSAELLFINGVPVATNAIGPQTMATTRSNFRISRDDNGNVPFNGGIDEVSVYSRALAPAEIQAIFNASTAGKCKPADTNAPTVIATAPDYGRLGLPANTVLGMTFSETMDQTTLTTNTVFVTDSLGNPVPGTFAYSLANRTATFTPLAEMPDGTNTLTITTRAQDLDGNPLAANFNWSFWVNANAIMLTNNTLIDTNNSAYDGMDLLVSNCTVSLNGSHSFDGLRVMNSGALNIAGGTTLSVTQDLKVQGNSSVLCQGANNTSTNASGQWVGQGVTINASNVFVEAGSKITADGQGYMGTTGNSVGPGGGVWVNSAVGGGGGGYGGVGGYGYAWVNPGGPTYGSLLQPVDLGSSGSSWNGCWSGNGGGAIGLVVGGTLDLEGLVSANGSGPQQHSGAGSGGSIWVTTGILKGAGLFQANGANYASGQTGGGGGGGRIAVYYQDGSGYSNYAAATVTGGVGWQNGSPGSVVFMDTSVPGNHLWLSGPNEVFAPSNSLHYGAVTLENQADLTIGAYSTFLVDGALEVKSNSTLTLGGGTVLTVNGNLNVTSNSTVLCQGANNTGQVGNQWVGVGVTINASNVFVEAGSKITADGQGYVGTTGNSVGPGGGVWVNSAVGGSGGGYGGVGGYGYSWVNPGGPTYGSLLQPVDLGSSGSSWNGCWSGNGGGAIGLVVGGTLDLEGVVSANGSGPQQHSGAGSGGSIWVTTSILKGAGLFQANGANYASGQTGGGGGGGRIAVYYQDGSGYSNYAAATVTGGLGWQNGSPGSVVFMDTSVPGNHLWLSGPNEVFAPSNSLHYGAVTLDNQAGLIIGAYSTFQVDRALEVSGGSTLTLGGGTVLTVAGNLNVTSNSTVLCQGANNTGQLNSQWVGVGVTINASNVFVEAGSKITADGQGYVGTTGNSVGPGGGGLVNSGWGGGGGGYGGVGGYGYNWGNSGGPTYGSLLQPVDLGSSGSSWAGRWSGNGGGAIQLVVVGTLDLEGLVSANGWGPQEHSGAGSGGSIWVTTGILKGAGLFQANGANYASGETGGGGGGGRIAVYYQDGSGYSSYAAATVAGGVGWQNGSPGSVVFMDTSVPGNHLWLSGPNEVFAPSNNLHYGAVTLDNQADLTIGAYSTFLVDGALEVSSNSTLTLGGGTVLTVNGNLNVTGNSTVLCQGANNIGQVGNQWAGVGPTINASNVFVEAGSKITADGQGYVATTGAGVGPGAGAWNGGGNAGGGGGYGGIGGYGDWVNAGGPTYGSLLQPVDLGSSGGSFNGTWSGSGGGAIQLVVGGTFDLEGLVSANGLGPQSHSGAGSGGSIWVTTGILKGTGLLQANGANFNSGFHGGGGGGGRIAVYYQDGSGYSSYAAATVTGGAGLQNGARGSIVFTDTSVPQNHLWVYAANDQFGASNSLHYAAITLDGGAALTMGASSTLAVDGLVQVTGGSSLTVGTGTVFSVGSSVEVTNNSTLTLGGGTILSVTGNLDVTSNSTVVCGGANNTGQVTNQWVGVGPTINASNVFVEAGSAITADGQGYVASTSTGVGPGAGAYNGGNAGGGGGYGGVGGYGDWVNAGGLTYGSLLQPVDLGSSGGSWNGTWSGNGGGAIHLVIGGTLDLEGLVSANGWGPQSHSGAGSGGSIWVTTGVLKGAGLFQANGANYNPGYHGGGGGGGRIAVYYQDGSGYSSYATATVTGGTGLQNGSPGSVVFVDTSVPGQLLQLYGPNEVFASSNSLHYGAVTLDNQAGLTIGANSTFLVDGVLQVRGGSTMTLGGGTVLTVDGNLNVTSNSTVLCLGANNTGTNASGQWVGQGVTINASNMFVEAGSAITADGQGYVANTGAGVGPGAGAYNGGNAGGGGGYGGVGGYGDWVNPGGPTYGSLLQPVDLGSSGGSYAGTWSGNGGGAIHLVIGGTLDLEGLVSANGSGPQSHSGAGSGGSIWVTTGVLKGAGLFQANGANFDSGYHGGGGGGGRIAVYYQDGSGYSSYAAATVTGGAGLQNGSSGSIVFMDTSVPGNHLWLYGPNEVFASSNSVHYGTVTLDNQAGLTIGAYSTFLVDRALEVRGGSTLNLGGGTVLTVDGNLNVTSNSTVLCLGANNTSTNASGQWVGQGVTINASNVLVEAGSQITADAQGYIGGIGAWGNDYGCGPGGAGADSGHGGGGGYGGAGGAAYAGGTYGSPFEPVDLGSGGALNADASPGGRGGNGGGAIRLIVAGSVTLNGTITANGENGQGGEQGAGAGGSLWVSCGTLAGSGLFAANGGAGQGSGGGGGGGRIAIYYSTNNAFIGFVASTANPVNNGGQQGSALFMDTSLAHPGLYVYNGCLLPPGLQTNFASVAVTAGGWLVFGANSQLRVDEGVTVTNRSSLTLGGGTILGAGSLNVLSNSTVLCQGVNNTAQVNNQWAGVGVTILATTVFVEAGSLITADAQGYIGGIGAWADDYGRGPGGAGADAGHGGGGGYGGVGGAAYGGATYGSPFEPLDFGSGGALNADASPGGRGGNGGGAIRLIVAGRVTLNGTITANGENGQGGEQGAGAGGSLWVSCDALAGSGLLAANGGAGQGNGGGGGGGRIAVYYRNGSSYNSFALATTSGGSGSQYGSRGSVVFVDITMPGNHLWVYDGTDVFGSSNSLHYGAVTLDTGTALTVGAFSTLTVDSVLDIKGASTLTLGGGTVLTAGSLNLASNSTIFCQGANNTAQVNNQWAGVGVTINASNLFVEAGSLITADAQGYIGGIGAYADDYGRGPGGAGADTGHGGGGGYGGAGGAAYGGGTYGSPFEPLDLGSGGALNADAGPGGRGGNGGGAIRLIVAGRVTLNGTITANGENGQGGEQGAGAGGSLWLSCHTLAGSGLFAANGGAGQGSGGGGGGGRIAVDYTNSTFTGLSACTANPVNNGGQQGSVLFMDTSLAHPGLYVYTSCPLPPGLQTNFASVAVMAGGWLAFATNSQIQIDEGVTVTNGSSLIIGGASTLAVNGTLAVCDTSSVVCQKLNLPDPANGNWAGIGVLLGAASVRLPSGATFVLEGQIISPDIELNGALLTGSGVVGAGTMNWTSGELSDCTLALSPNALLNLSGPADKVLHRSILNNAGTINWSGTGNLQGYFDNSGQSVSINNRAGATFNIQSDASVVFYQTAGYGGDQFIFDNAGLIRKTAGAGANAFAPALINSGTLDIQQGAINLLGGGNLAGGALIFGLTSATNYGHLILPAGSVLDGALQAVLNPAWSLFTGDSFPVVTFGSAAGAFTTCALPTAAAWQTNYSAGAFTLTVMNVRPVLPAIPDQVVNEQSTLSLNLCALNPGPQEEGRIVGVWIPTNSMDGSCHALNDAVWSVQAPPYPLTTTNGISYLINQDASTLGGFTLQDDVYVTNNVPDPTRSVVTFQFDAPVTVSNVTLIQHSNGITRIEGFIGNDTNTLVSIGSVFGPRGDVVGTNQFVEGETNVFQFPNTKRQPATFFQLVIRKTSYASGYALYRAYPADGAGLQFSPALGHRDTLTYTLSGPTNALLSSNGLFTWTPTEAQAPGVYTITTVVTDYNPYAVNSPYLSATNSFHVTVNVVNIVPVLPTNIPPQIVGEGMLLTVNDAAVNTDIPANQLLYALLSSPGGASIATNGVVTWTPAHSQAPGLYTITVKVTDTNAAAVNTNQLSATNSFSVQVVAANHPPVLAPITNRVVNDLATLVVSASATDPDVGDVLTFSLGAGAPLGAAINPQTGIFTWTPAAQQAPGQYSVTITVTDNGSARGCRNLSASTTFTITVLKVNLPPVLAAISNYVVTAGETVAFVATATDPNWPTNTLTFSLGTSSLFQPGPTNATLNAATGSFRWPTSDQDAGDVVWFFLTVTNNGVPGLATSCWFEVEVQPRPELTVTLINGQPWLVWNSTAGRHYQAQYKSLLGDLPWTNLGAAIVATNNTATLVDTTLKGATSRIYRVKLLP